MRCCGRIAFAEQQRSHIPTEDRNEQFCAAIEFAAIDGLALVHTSGHVQVLSALPGEEKDDGGRCCDRRVVVQAVSQINEQTTRLGSAATHERGTRGTFRAPYLQGV